MAATSSNSGPGMADIELSTISAMQENLHYGGEIFSPFGRSGSGGSSNKSSWNTPAYDQIRSTGNDRELIFHLNKSYDFLGEVAYIQVIPELTVAPKYRASIRIAWPHNFHHQVCHNRTLLVNGTKVQTFNTEIMDNYYQVFVEDKDSYDQDVGNIAILNEWSSHLPQFPVSVSMPWFSTEDTGQTIPFALCREANWEIHLELQNNISRLLRVQRLNKETGKWETTKFRTRYLSQCELGKIVVIPQPQLWGLYFKVPMMEKMFMHDKMEWDGKMHIKDYMVVSSDNPQSLGEKVTLELPCSWPVMDIFIVMENVTAMENNNGSNRGTHPDEGLWSPCKNVSMAYGGSQKFSLPHYHLDKGTLRKLYPGSSTKPGYLVYPFCVEPNSLSVMAGRTLSLHKTFLTVELGDTNPLARDLRQVVDDSDGDVSSDEDHDVQENIPKGYPGENEVRDSKFRVHVLIRHIKEIEFIKNKGGFYSNCNVSRPPLQTNVGTQLIENMDEQINLEVKKKCSEAKMNTIFDL